jgi:hypothetical protein
MPLIKELIVAGARAPVSVSLLFDLRNNDNKVTLTIRFTGSSVDDPKLISAFVGSRKIINTAEPKSSFGSGPINYETRISDPFGIELSWRSPLSEKNLDILNQCVTYLGIDSTEFLDNIRQLNAHGSIDRSFDALLKEKKIKECFDLVEIATPPPWPVDNKSRNRIVREWIESQRSVLSSHALRILAHKLHQVGEVELALKTYLKVGCLPRPMLADNFRQFFVAENILALLKKLDSKKLNKPMLDEVLNFTVEINKQYPGFSLEVGEVLEQKRKYQAAYQLYENYPQSPMQMGYEPPEEQYKSHTQILCGLKLIINTLENVAKAEKNEAKANAKEGKAESQEAPPQTYSPEVKNTIDAVLKQYNLSAEKLYSLLNDIPGLGSNHFNKDFDDFLTYIIETLDPFIQQEVNKNFYQEANLRCAKLKVANFDHEQKKDEVEGLDEELSENAERAMQLKQALEHALLAGDKDLFNGICNHFIWGDDLTKTGYYQNWTKEFHLQFVSACPVDNKMTSETIVYVYAQGDQIACAGKNKLSGVYHELIKKFEYNHDPDYDALVAVLKDASLSDGARKKQVNPFMKVRLQEMLIEKSLIQPLPDNLDHLLISLAATKKVYEKLAMENEALKKENRILKGEEIASEQPKWSAAKSTSTARFSYASSSSAASSNPGKEEATHQIRRESK